MRKPSQYVGFRRFFTDLSWPNTYKIIGSVTSPFTRITRVVCEELGIPYEFEVTAPFGKLDENQDSFISSHNPLMRVPILIDEDVEVLDSRVIVRYLMKHHNEQGNFATSLPEDPAEDNVLTVIYGLIDAGILRFVLRITHPEIDASAGYMARSLNRIEHSFLWLEDQTILGQRFGVIEAALLCGLEWIQKRNIYQWEKFPNISKIYDMYCDRPSLQKTRIPDSA